MSSIGAAAAAAASQSETAGRVRRNSLALVRSVQHSREASVRPASPSSTVVMSRGMALLAAPSDPKDPDYYPFPKFPKQQGSTKEPTLAERAEIGDPAVFSSEYFDHEGFGATNKSLARQRLERAEQRGTQVLGGHHYLAAVAHVEDLTPHDEARSRRGEDLGEIGSWYKGPPPQHPREKAFGKFAGVAADPHRPGAYGDGGGSSSVLRRQSSSYGGAPGRSNSPLQNASPNAIRGGTPGKTSSQVIGGWFKPEMAVKEAHVVQSSSTSKKLEVLGGHADFH